MENLAYVSLSRQIAIRSQMDVIAQNLANLSTTAYKGERVMFAEYLFQGENSAQVSYVQEIGRHRDPGQGPLEHTGNKLDLAIQGNGYFVVSNEDGELLYTRQGHFRLDEKRNLTTTSGEPVLSKDGRKITFKPEDTTIDVNHDGVVTAQSGVVGRLNIVAFENEADLVRLANGKYYADPEAPQTDAKGTTVQQGMLEGSNVTPIVEMTRMIDLLRSYQSAQKLTSADHELRRKAITDLAATA